MRWALCRVASWTRASTRIADSLSYTKPASNELEYAARTRAQRTAIFQTCGHHRDGGFATAAGRTRVVRSPFFNRTPGSSSCFRSAAADSTARCAAHTDGLARGTFARWPDRPYSRKPAPGTSSQWGYSGPPPEVPGAVRGWLLCCGPHRADFSPAPAGRCENRAAARSRCDIARWHLQDDAAVRARRQARRELRH